MGDFKKIYILQTDFEGKKSCKEISDIQLQWLCMSGKNILSPEVEMKQIAYANQISYTSLPPSKVKWSAP